MYYKTADIALAAVLTSKGYPIISLDFETEKRAWFNFEDKTILRKIIEQYNQGKLKVEPRDFFTRLRDVKTRIYDEKRN